MINTCSGCDATWTGTRTCHCSGCHQTFSGITLFDKHRAPRGERGACLDPATITEKGALLEPRKDVWSGPEMSDDVKVARFG